MNQDIPKVGAVEIHLSRHTELPSSLRRRIKAAGGSYTHCRSKEDRFINIPYAARELINEVVLLSTRKNVTMIARGAGLPHNVPAHVIVHFYPGATATRPPMDVFDSFFKAAYMRWVYDQKQETEREKAQAAKSAPSENGNAAWVKRRVLTLLHGLEAVRGLANVYAPFSITSNVNGAGGSVTMHCRDEGIAKAVLQLLKTFGHDAIHKAFESKHEVQILIDEDQR